MMRQVALSGEDPHEAIHKVLVRKLTWVNAKPWINSKYHHDEEEEKRWKTGSRLDLEYLETELREAVDEAWMYYYDHDHGYLMFRLQQIQVRIWIMGPKYMLLGKYYTQAMLNAFHQDLDYYSYEALKVVCEEMCWKLSQFEKRYMNKEHTKELGDNYGKDFKG